MSCWIVTDYHINALVSFAAAQPHASYWCEATRNHVPFKGNEAAIAHKLMAANVASVNHRYAHHEEMPAEAAIAQARFHYRAVPAIDPVVVLKSCACLAYQSNEVDAWDGSEAFTIIGAIKDAAIGALPGYDGAPWGLEPPARVRGTRGHPGGNLRAA